MTWVLQLFTMTLRGETMNQNKCKSLFLVSLILISILSMNVSADSDDAINDENPSHSING